jgi:hypothetical protein
LDIVDVAVIDLEDARIEVARLLALLHVVSLPLTEALRAPPTPTIRQDGRAGRSHS